MTNQGDQRLSAGLVQLVLPNQGAVEALKIDGFQELLFRHLCMIYRCHAGQGFMEPQNQANPFNHGPSVP